MTLWISFGTQLKGASAGGAVLLAMTFSVLDDEGWALAIVPLGVAIPVLTALAGGAIDWMINRTVYERPLQPSRVTVAPMAGRERLGVIVRIKV